MGIFVATIILVLWAGHLFLGLFIYQFDPQSVLSYLPILLQAYLYTGLFITAHDSMHGAVAKKRWLNDLYGKLSLGLFAAFSYRKMYKKHIAHHRFAGTAKDPDFDETTQNFFLWFFHFFVGYVSLGQIIIMALVFNGFLYILQVPLANLLLYWILPAFLSTFQLFYFGTFLPHRKPHLDDMEPHKARTQRANHLWAMISCYFFGYHFEHHVSPRTPWWRLYKAKEKYLQGNLTRERV